MAALCWPYASTRVQGSGREEPRDERPGGRSRPRPPACPCQRARARRHGQGGSSQRDSLQTVRISWMDPGCSDRAARHRPPHRGTSTDAQGASIDGRERARAAPRASAHARHRRLREPRCREAMAARIEYSAGRAQAHRSARDRHRYRGRSERARQDRPRLLRVKLWRVARAAHATSGPAAFTGIGGMSVDGRWHTRGRPIVYTARTESLAKLEALVHLNPTIAPRLVLVEATIPDHLVATLHGAPPAGWNDVPDSGAACSVGDTWLQSGSSLASRYRPRIRALKPTCSSIPRILNSRSSSWAIRFHFAFDGPLIDPGL